MAAITSDLPQHVDRDHLPVGGAQQLLQPQLLGGKALWLSRSISAGLALPDVESGQAGASRSNRGAGKLASVHRSRTARPARRGSRPDPRDHRFQLRPDHLHQRCRGQQRQQVKTITSVIAASTMPHSTGPSARPTSSMIDAIDPARRSSGSPSRNTRYRRRRACPQARWRGSRGAGCAFRTPFRAR